MTTMVSLKELRTGKAPGQNTIKLQIGDVCCAFTCRDTGIIKKFKRLYHDFLFGQPADITIELEATERLSPNDLMAALSDNKYVHENNHFRSTSQVVAGEYDLEKRYIKITGERNLANPDLECNQLNQLLAMAYYSACKVKYDGLLPAMILHACGILRYGHVILFMGPSEAGKTTIARLCGRRNGEVINDEMLLVTRSDKNGKGFNVKSAPFVGRVSSRRNVTAPLQSILLLKKGSNTAANPIDRTEAYLRIMRQIITPAYIGQKDKKAVLSLMTEFSDDLTKVVPVYELEFNLDEKSLWKTVGGLDK